MPLGSIGAPCWRLSWRGRDDETVVQPQALAGIIATLVEQGYTYVPSGLLTTAYTGRNPGIKGIAYAILSALWSAEDGSSGWEGAIACAGIADLRPVVPQGGIRLKVLVYQALLNSVVHVMHPDDELRPLD